MIQLIHSNILQKLQTEYNNTAILQLISLLENYINPHDYEKICILKLDYLGKILNFEVLINNGYYIMDYWKSKKEGIPFNNRMHYELGIGVLELTTTESIGDMETKICKKDKVCFEVKLDENFELYLRCKYSKWVRFKNQNWN